MAVLEGDSPHTPEGRSLRVHSSVSWKTDFRGIPEFLFGEIQVQVFLCKGGVPISPGSSVASP